MVLAFFILLIQTGFQSVVNGVHEILLGESQIVATGGAENMSQAPYAVRGIRFGTQLGKNPPFEDTLWSALTDSYAKVPMGITAENLAEQYKISRKEVDEFSLGSQLKWAEAQKKGIFDTEIAPIQVKGKKGPEDFKVDEGPRPATTIEGLNKVPSSFLNFFFFFSLRIVINCGFLLHPSAQACVQGERCGHRRKRLWNY